MAKKTPDDELPKLTVRECAAKVIVDLNGRTTTLSALAKKAKALYETGDREVEEDRMWNELLRLLQVAESLGLVDLETTYEVDVKLLKKLS
jgi:hypothetical protein